MHASHSETESFRRCERAHYYSYGLELQSQHPSVALIRGSIGHVVLAAYYTDRQSGISHAMAVETARNVLRIELEQADEFYDKEKLTVELAKVLGAYFEYIKDEELEVLAVEQRFDIAINEEFTLPFIVDLICRFNGKIEAWDHKFVWDFYNEKFNDLSPQLALYKGGLSLLGYGNIGLRYNELRYRDTAENKANPAARFFRPAVSVSKSRVMQTMEEQIRVGRRIFNLKAMGLEKWETFIVRSANNNTCRNCEFAALCVADLNGEDRSMYLGFDYRKKERR